MSNVRSVKDSSTPTNFSWAGVWNSATTSYYLLLGSTVALVVFGLIMVLSSSSIESLGRNGTAYSIFLRQLMFAVGGTIALVVAVFVKVDTYKKIAWLALGAAVALQCLVFIMPSESGSALGNRNWIRIGSISLQPSEFMKVAVAVFLGTVISRKLATTKNWRDVLIPALGGAAVGIGLVMAGKDLGTVMILCLVVAGSLFIAGLPMKWFGLVGGAGLIFIAIATLFSKNRVARIMATYDRNCTTDDALCFQVIRGMEGLGTGGWGGVGLGAGSEKWAYLPEAQNDFIFSVIGEEVGFIGTSAVIMLFVLLGVGMVRVILRHTDPMVKITTGGIAAWILGQAVVNIGVVTRVFPVIGVPLPLVSAGGSALVATMLALGIVLAFARDEPGAREAFAARPSMVRKTIAVISGSSGRRVRRS